MITEFFIYGIITLYLSAVIPSEFGPRRQWHFPVTDLVTWIKNKESSASASGKWETSLAGLSDDDAALEMEDDDVRAERQRVDSGGVPADSPIIISHIRKVYPPRAPGMPPKVAVRDVAFAAEKGIVLGLLGPNGAGKTTLISMLTGLYAPSGGTARLSGFDIRTEIKEVYRVIGICPQFDIVWEDLSIEEHLYFYARLKGVNRHDERTTVEKAMEQ
ncbi:hypothetical protein HK405_002593, partial [Cladochytrium tenue]